ncbi:MAG: DUF6676 family protein [Mycobacterium sp.]
MTIAFLPAYIPVDICGTVGQDPATATVDQCMTTVLGQVRDGGVSSPPAVGVGGKPADAKAAAAASVQLKDLQHIVADAKGKGLDLKIVVLPTDPFTDPPMRDIATVVGNAYPGSTVLALSPAHVGSYSTKIDRVTLEAGEDLARTGNAVQSTQNFVSQVQTPIFPWTSFTIVLILGVALAAVGTRMLQLRARKVAADGIVGAAQN